MLKSRWFGSSESWLALVILLICGYLSLTKDTFLTLVNFADLMNASLVNIVFATGLLVVLITGGIDISFAVGASVVQYLLAITVMQIGGGNWAIGIGLAMFFGFCLGSINATLVYHSRIVSIIVTISTCKLFFGLLMFFTKGVSINNMPDWWADRIILFDTETEMGWAEITLPVAVMVIVAFATWLLLRRLNLARQIFAMGNNTEGARRIGGNLRATHCLAYGWLGMCAGIAGLMQAHHAQEIVPFALYGRELEVLAAVVLGVARLGGGRGSLLGAILGLALIAVTQNGLNLTDVSPYAFRMIFGAIILVAISLSNETVGLMLQQFRAAPQTKGGAS